MKKLILTLMFALSALFGNDFSPQDYKKAFERFSDEELMKKLISGVGELPMRIDSMTVLNKVEPKGKNFIGYYYTLNNGEDIKLETFDKGQKKVFLDVIKKQVADGLCKNNATVAVLDRGIKFGYFYSLENGKEFTSFIFSKNSCK